MLRNSYCLLLILCVPAALTLGAASQRFTDPAPPKVRPLPALPAPSPQKQEGLTFRAAPRPLAPGAVTHDWRSFLGPAQNATSTETPLLARFGPNGPAVVWEVTKGEGYASPAVVGERLILFHRVGDEEVVECLHAETGRRFWKHAYPAAYRDRYGYNGGPRCQAVSDGAHVFTFGVEGKLHCLKLATGQVVWARELLREFKLRQNFFGVGATPLIEGDRLIVILGAEGGPTVAAFHTRTGKMLWGAGNEWGPSYAAPIAATVGGRRRVFAFAGGESRPPTGGLLSIDPASGKIDFRFPWRASRRESVNASSPLVVGRQVYISECYGPGGALLDLLPDGSYRKLWSNNVLNTHFMTAIHKEGYLYGVDGHGPRNAPLVCIELRTGKEMWRIEPEWQETVRTPEGERRYQLSPARASLLRVDGRCLMLGEYGHLAWLDLNPKGYRELDRARLFLAGETWSMPVLSRGLLYVCQNSRAIDGTAPRLLCYDLRGAKGDR
jgi:outer membrane protein assembly factor BamB